MTYQSKVFLLSLFSLLYLAITYFILDSDTLVFGDNNHQDETEAISGTMSFSEMDG